ncbi:MAG: 30S ribosomal protein S20 [Myxococcales bacterium]|nr:30S ribosomal protein S20 [Myxococcales bacterium]
MANHKQALKRHKQSLKRRARNMRNKKKLKVSVKEVLKSLEAHDVEKAQESLKTAVKVISRTAAKGVIPKRRAARKIARLSKRVHLAATAQ